jgi:hypothetical protein
MEAPALRCLQAVFLTALWGTESELVIVEFTHHDSRNCPGDTVAQNILKPEELS